MVNADRTKRDVIVVGASAGGVEALSVLFESLPPHCPAVFAVVLHRSPVYNVNLAKVLGRKSSLPLIEPADGDPLKRGTIYLAPRDRHMMLTPDRIHLSRGPKEHFTRPAVDPLFHSAARVYGPRVVAVLLTGGGDDGVSGLIAVKGRSGLIVVQDPHEAKIPSMPLNAVLHDHVDLVLSLARIPPVLAALAQGNLVEPQLDAAM